MCQNIGIEQCAEARKHTYVNQYRESNRLHPSAQQYWDFIAIYRSAMERSEKREREDGDGFAGGRRVRRRVDEAKGSLNRWQ